MMTASEAAHDTPRILDWHNFNMNHRRLPTCNRRWEMRWRTIFCIIIWSGGHYHVACTIYFLSVPKEGFLFYRVFARTDNPDPVSARTEVDGICFSFALRPYIPFLHRL